MKYLFAVIGLAAVVLAAFGADSVWVNGQAVIVNDTMITREEVEGSIADPIQTLYRRYARQPQVLNQKITELRRDRLQMLIDRQLILQEFKAKGYNVPDSVFEKELNRTIREQFGDRLKLNKTLQAQGMTYESYAKQNREQLVVDLMTHEFVSADKIMVSPLKIQSYYAQNPDQFKVEDQVRLRMIVIAQASDAPAGTARKLADEIMAKLNEGASFAEMASIYSSGSQRSQGGDWGWVERKVLQEDLSAIAFNLKAGQRSGVIEKKDGCYIMLVEDLRPAHSKPLSEVDDEVERRLKNEEFDRLRQKWLDRLRSKAFIRYF